MVWFILHCFRLGMESCFFLQRKFRYPSTYVCVWKRVGACVSVCELFWVWEHVCVLLRAGLCACDRVCTCLLVWAYVSVYACVCACVKVRERVWVCVCTCVGLWRLSKATPCKVTTNTKKKGAIFEVFFKTELRMSTYFSSTLVAAVTLYS